jgi:hypothetical protein
MLSKFLLRAAGYVLGPGKYRKDDTLDWKRI